MSKAQSIQLPEWATGFVYLLETAARWKWQKIGFSISPRERLKGFRGLPFRVWLGHYFPVYSWQVEQTIMLNLAAKRVRGEWFTLDKEDIELFRTITEVRTTPDLPEPFRKTVFTPLYPAKPKRSRNDFPLAPMVRKGMSRMRPWWRSGAGEWYVQFRRKQHALGICDKNDFEGAKIAMDILVAKLVLL